MTWRQHAVIAVFAAIAASASVAARQSFAITQQSMIMIGNDNVMIRGCVRPADPRAYMSTDVVVWGHGNVMLTGITGPTLVTPLGTSTPYPVGTAGLANRVFYWLDDDDDLLECVGQLVEVRGELTDFERGEVEIDQDRGYPKIDLDLAV